MSLNLFVVLRVLRAKNGQVLGTNAVPSPQGRATPQGRGWYQRSRRVSVITGMQGGGLQRQWG